MFKFMLLSPTAEKVTKERRTGGEVSFAKKQTSRIFAPFNILPLVDPPLAVFGYCYFFLRFISFVSLLDSF